MPANTTAKGAVIFILNQRPDTSQHLDEFNIIKPATDKGLAVLFISTGVSYLDFFIEEDSIESADKLIGSTLEKYNISKKNVLLGGLSLSGTRAMKYAIFCERNKSKFNIHPKALVLCDAPLDMVRLWDECEKSTERNYNETAANEGFYCLEYLKRYLGGSPEKNLEKYIAYSPFCYKEKNGGNAKFLSHMPIRAYHEPDINWWIKNRGKECYSMNSIDMAALINELWISGNKKTELITTINQRKGVDNNNSPHTWSMIDNNELVNWFLKLK